EDGDAQLRALSRTQDLRCPQQLRLVHAPALVSPRAHRVQTDREDALAAIDGLCGLPMPLELGVRAREAAGEGVRNVVIAGYDEERRPELEQQLRGLLVLARFSAVRKVSAGDH